MPPVVKALRHLRTKVAAPGLCPTRPESLIEAGLMTERPPHLSPGVKPALDVAGGRDPCGLSRLHRHGRSLSIGTIEHNPLARCGRKLMEHPAFADMLSQIRIGRVQRARNAPVLLPFSALPEINKDHIRPIEQGNSRFGRHGPAPSSDLVLSETDMHVGGNRQGIVVCLGWGASSCSSSPCTHRPI